MEGGERKQGAREGSQESGVRRREAGNKGQGYRRGSRSKAEIDRMGLEQKDAIMQATTSWEEKGMEKATKAIALNMLKDNFSLEQISRLTGLTIPQLQQLQAENP